MDYKNWLNLAVRLIGINIIYKSLYYYITAVNSSLGFYTGSETIEGLLINGIVMSIFGAFLALSPNNVLKIIYASPKNNLEDPEKYKSEIEGIFKTCLRLFGITFFTRFINYMTSFYNAKSSNYFPQHSTHDEAYLVQAIIYFLLSMIVVFRADFIYKILYKNDYK